MLEKPSTPEAVQKLILKKGLLTRLENIYHLTIKELRSIRADYILLVLVLYTFTIAVYTVAHGVSTNPQDLTVGVVDEDQSNLSRQFVESPAAVQARRSHQCKRDRPHHERRANDFRSRNSAPV